MAAPVAAPTDRNLIGDSFPFDKPTIATFELLSLCFLSTFERIKRADERAERGENKKV